MGGAADAAALGRNDTGCYRRGKSEGIAYCENPLPYLEIFAVAHRNYREILCIDLNESDIGRGIGAHNGGVEGAVVIESYFEAFGSVNHVVVGDDVAVV